MSLSYRGPNDLALALRRIAALRSPPEFRLNSLGKVCLLFKDQRNPFDTRSSALRGGPRLFELLQKVLT
jgi:hypothetical protein